MVNLIWFINERNIHCVSSEQQGVSQARNSTISQALCADELSCSIMQKFNYPQRHVNAITLHIFLWLQL